MQVLTELEAAAATDDFFDAATADLFFHTDVTV